jgi:hypothetical protein
MRPVCSSQVETIGLVLGTFAWNIDPEAIAEACERWPRTGFEDEVRRAWSEESDRFPYGRAQFARVPGVLPQLIRFNPLPNRRGSPEPSGLALSDDQQTHRRPR